jgi:hypothetical protein
MPIDCDDQAQLALVWGGYKHMQIDQIVAVYWHMLVSVWHMI